ncbi:MAG: aspartyl-tRNA(Asn)/glutamyl-tRNA(Gln) amidotransferase subunit B [Luteibaculaceae bacterium]|jgi:aspartyl-tRNA(Asn)/glutamyl-tRNA(Gln) amidotransferase subunit B
MEKAPYNKYEIVIGLEIHIQLATESKAYCADKNEYGSLPNSLTGPISLGHPGTLPVLNEKSVEFATKLGLALGCDIRRDMHFARKNYFYADLPKGYQITQDDTPICSGGTVLIKNDAGEPIHINVTRIHMEEDSGKSTHDQDPIDTLIDLNRAGVPLLEIVSEPELRTPQEAYNYVTEIRKLVRYLEICDGNMEEGSMRCDANVSVRIKGENVLNTRSEVKNMNSIRNVYRAIEVEAVRQVDLMESGGTVIQDTRNYDAVSNTTTSMRSKEFAHDYRYFPEPDLQPVFVSEEFIQNVQAHMPPLPNELFNKYTHTLNLSEYDAGVLTDSKPIALYFESLIQSTTNYKAAANWLMGDIKSYLNNTASSIERFPIEPQRIADLITIIDAGKISSTIASQKVFPEMLRSSDSAISIAEKLNLIQDSGEDEIQSIAQGIIDKWPDKVEAYRAGNKSLLGLFMGQFMKESKGKADPKKANQIIRELLDK